MSVSNNNTGIPDSVVKWLFQVSNQIYSNNSRQIFNDSLLILSHFKNLRPRTRVFTDYQGKSNLLLCIYGDFTNTVTNLQVPFLIWVPVNYPSEHPIVNINMETLGTQLKINLGPHVDSNGTIYLPCFEKPQCTLHDCLMGLLNILDHESLFIAERAPPILPPKPHDISHQLQKLKLDATPPPLPELPPGHTRRNEVLSPPPIPERLPSNTPSKIPTRPTVTNSPKVELARVAKVNKKEHSEVPDFMDQEQRTNSHDAILSNLNDLIGVISENEKNLITNELNRFDTSNLVTSIKNNLDFETNSIENFQNIIKNYSIQLHEKINDLKKFEDKQLNKVYDDVIVHETVAMKQIYDMVCKDYALDDSIKLCVNLLNKGILTLDLFVKTVRNLSREQFLVRFHIRKLYNILEE
ncbi:hypothetical protein KAFR_0I02270 [Kazachstania africana CBS 2517]|uniref:UEV domain-containing protein n=1 Tax=Kazachstania africana (strain ATCC 22294 / BCRC 22015 / CBS 2517 / CECT 1963 / NBRC 1671 / NRRL Y-8276) TaxID=1071382 RepID=H2B056_KAZAF|nr:hypothetical protein KAFR_0I02270 [Kazachstania africana CBS 2517]CCF60006.1 hypothetical protein KAFR_0I02270 [Kazachstania africana CBS 2517]